MKKLLFGVILLTSGCSSVQLQEPERKDNLFLHQEYVDARNDLRKVLTQSNSHWGSKGISLSPPNTTHFSSWGHSHMIVCDEEVTECKQAFVSSNISYRVVGTQDEMVLEGNFNTQVGRSIRLESSNGFIEYKISDEVPTALEKEETIPFRIPVVLGESQTIVGPADDRVTLTIVDRR